MDELVLLKDLLHFEAIEEFKKTYYELDVVLYMSLFGFLLPLSLLGKAIFAKIEQKTFIMTSTNYTDIIISILVAFVWIMTAYYRSKEVSPMFFSEEED